MRFSPDGRLLAVASQSGSVLLFNPATGASTPKSTSHLKEVHSLEFSPDSRRIAAASLYGDIWLGDTEKGDTIANLEGFGFTISHLVFSPDGQRLAAWNCDENAAKFWDGVRGSPVSTMTGVDGELAFSPDSMRLLSFGCGTRTKLWQPQEGKLVRDCDRNHATAVFSPNSKKLALFHNDTDKIDLRNGETGQLLFDSLCGEVGPRRNHSRQHLVFSPDSQYLASVLTDLTLQLWNTADGTRILTLPAFSHSLQSISYSTDGERLICREEGGILHRFHVGRKAPFLTPLDQYDGFSFVDPETSPAFDVRKEDHSLYLVSASGKQMLCCTLPASISIQGESEMEFFHNMVAIGCSDGRVVFLRISM